MVGHGRVGRSIFVCAAGEGSEALKAIVNGVRELDDGLVIAISGGEKNDEKREKDGDEVRVGDDPAVVGGMLLGVAAPSHGVTAFGSAAGAAATFARLRCGREGRRRRCMRMRMRLWGRLRGS